MIGQRIKELRKKFNLTQQEFCERIGVKRNTIAKYETERGEPIDAVISLICREFDVNEQWLRTGDGDMFAAKPFDLGAYIERRGVSELESEILKAYFDLDPDIRQEFLKHFRKRLSGVTSDPAQSTPSESGESVDLDRQARWEKEARSRAEAYYQELLERGPGSDIDVKGAEAAYAKSLGIAPSAGRFVSNTTDGSGVKLA